MNRIPRTTLDQVRTDVAEIMRGRVMSDPALSFLPDGRHRCCICCEAKTRDELEPVTGEPGRVWDVCTDCAAREKEQGAHF